MDQKALFDLNREHALRAHERAYAQIDAAGRLAVEASNVALRALLLINGGAVIALLAFVGAIETGNGAASTDATLLAQPIQWFAVGVGLSVTAAAFAYLIALLDQAYVSQVKLTMEHPYAHYPPQKAIGARDILHWIAICLGALSLFAFFWGVWTVTGAIPQLGI